MPVKPDTYANFGSSSIQGGAGGAGTLLNAGDSSVLLQPGDGTKFPSVGPFRILIGTATGANEIAIATANASDILTLTRGASVDEPQVQTAQTWGVGTPVQQVATAGSLTRLTNQLPAFNVRNYGAKGDGVQDDAPFFRLCANDIRSAGGGIMYVPGTGGTPYLINSMIANPTYGGAGQIVNEGFWLPSHSTLMGDGPAQSILKLGASQPNQTYLCSNYQAGAINPGEDEDITICDIGFDGNAANNTAGTVDAQYGPALYHVRRVTLRNIVSKNFRGTTAGGNGANATNGESNQLGCFFCLDVVLHNVHVLADSGQTSSGIAINNCTNVTETNVIAERMSLSMGVAHFQSQNISLASCAAYLNGNHGLNFESCDIITASSCIGGSVFQATLGGTQWYTTGQSLGNTGSGFTFKACTNIFLADCIGNKNGQHGVNHNTAGAGQMRIHGGEYLTNGQAGIGPDTNGAYKIHMSGRVLCDNSNPSGAVLTGDALITHSNSIEGLQAAPAIPATTVAKNNPYPYACWVLILGGAVTNVSITPLIGTGAGISQVASATPCTVIVPSGHSITLTYSVIPTSWIWTGMVL